MQIDGFLKVPDIPGPSERDGHEEEIEVYGMDFRMEAPYDANSQARRGRVDVGQVFFTKDYDMASPYLKKALFENTMLDEVVFSARRTIEGETSDYLVVTLTNASVSSYQLHPSAAKEGVLEEEVGFSFHKIKFVYDSDHEIEMDVRVGK